MSFFRLPVVPDQSLLLLLPSRITTDVREEYSVAEYADAEDDGYTFAGREGDFRAGGELIEVEIRHGKLFA